MAKTLHKCTLECDSVRKSFSGKMILSDVFLRCQTGDIIGLLGRNGSGKSTLLKLIRGIIPADEMFIRVDGKCSIKDISQSISYLSQNGSIPNHLRVKTAIKLSIEADKIPTFLDDSIIAEIIDKKINQLSTGQQRYLEIKLVLSNNSKFVLLDEPYQGISPLLVEKVNQLIVDSSASKGIVLTDHNYRNVITIASQLKLMKDRKLHHLENKEQLVELGYLSDNSNLPKEVS